MSQLDERRAHERYEMPLPCMISISEDNVDSKLIERSAKNISGGGIFLSGSGGSAVGATVKVDIVIPPSLLTCSDNGGTHISATGCIVRLEAGGMAISFRDDYRVSSLEQVLRFLDRKRAWLGRQKEEGLIRIQSNPSAAPGENSNDTGETGKTKAGAYALEA